MFKFINAESKTIIGAATIVGVLSFASRIVGLIRDRILAGEFGASSTLDVYYAAFKVPDLMFSLIVVGALSASFIPLFTKHYSKIPPPYQGGVRGGCLQKKKRLEVHKQHTTPDRAFNDMFVDRIVHFCRATGLDNSPWVHRAKTS